MTTRRLAVAMSLACGLAVAGLFAPARADENHFTIGSQWWSQTAPEAKFQEFRQVPRGGFLENFLYGTNAGNTGLTLWGANGLRKDQATRLSIANSSKWRIDLGYAQIPHDFSDIAHSPYVQGSPGFWMLPDTLQAKNQNSPSKYTQTMQDLLANSPNIPLNFNTNISNVRARARPVKGWQFEARGSMRERSGDKPYAMTFGFSTAMEVPEPIHQQMVDGDLIANYQHDNLKLMASGGMSAFSNKVGTMSVDNPKRLTDVNGGDGPKTGVMDMYPDNRVIRGNVALSYLLPKRTALTGTFGMSHGTQDDPFLRPTSNTALPQSSLDSLPARSLNGKVNTYTGDVRLSSHPVNKLDAAVRFHYNKYDNKTEPLEFTGFAPYDVSWQRRIYTESDVAENSQWVGGADLDYALSHEVRLGGTAEYRVRERSPREIEKDKESVVGGRLRLRPVSAMQIDGKYTHGDRKNDGFNLDDYMGYTTRLAVPVTGVYDSLVQIEQSALRRFDVADRTQDKANAGLSYAFNETFDASASYAYVNNDYKNTTLGLTAEKEHTVAATGTMHVNERLDLNAGYGFDWMRSNQASRQSGSATLSVNPADNWAAELKDNDVFAQGGFEWEARPKVTLTGDYQFSRHAATFHFTNGGGAGFATFGDLPNTIYRLHQLVTEARYQWQKNTSVSLRYGFEEYDTNDWAVTNVPLIFPVTGTSNAVFFGNSALSYRAHRAAVIMRHTF